ncbi:MAG: MFS transporter [Chloroflexi bacterium]|nr:MFS transporter [Chloroflexota bacterium]
MSTQPSLFMSRFSGQRAFYAVTFGQFISLLGSGMTRFGLGIWVLRETGDTTAYSALLFFAVLPVGLGSIFTGTLVDRWNRRVVMLAGNTVASLSTLVAALLFFGGALEIWHLYIVLTVNGIANAFVIPSMEASVPMLVKKENLGRAAGLTQLTTSLELIVSPALAGILLVSSGLGFIFIVDFVTFGACVIALALSAIPQPAPDPAPNPGNKRAGLLGEFIFGFRYIAERPPFVYLMTLVTLAFFLMPGIGYALSTPLALSVGDERAAGLIRSSFGAGAMISGILLTAWGGPKRRMYGVLASLAIAGLASILIGARESIPLMAAGTFCIGVTFMFMFGMNRVIWQVKAAPEVLGRISSLRMALGSGASSIGVLVAGPLAQHVFEPMMAEGGALAGSFGPIIGVGDGRGMALIYIIEGLMLITIVAVSALTRRIRLMEDLLPDQTPSANVKNVN